MRKKLFIACGAAAFALPLPALAVECSTLGITNAIWGSGGSAATPTLKAIARAIQESSAPDNEKFTLFYADPSACIGYRAFVAGSSGASGLTFKYWIKGTNTDQTCTASNQPLDFAHMGSEAEFCQGETLPAGIGDFPGPIQTVNVIRSVKATKAENDAISAEALHFIYGYGVNGQVSPWTDGSGVVQRTNTSFVHNYIAAAIKVPENAFWWTTTAGWDPANGTDPKAQYKPNQVTSNGASVDFITNYTGDPEQTLGYISGSQADTNRAKVKTLAFKGFDQDLAVYPDKDGASLDKINVRLGRYALWSPGHFFAKKQGSAPENQTIASLIGWFAGHGKAPGNVDVVRTTIEAGDIPECAMQAYRDTAVGPVYSYAPKKPCGCFFETIATGAQPAACVACSADSECPGDGQKCNYGYCEAYRASGESEG